VYVLGWLCLGSPVMSQSRGRAGSNKLAGGYCAEPGSASPRQRKGASKKMEARMSFRRIGTMEEGVARLTDSDRRLLDTEKALVDIYDKLGTVEGYLEDAQSEIYLTTFRDRW